MTSTPSSFNPLGQITYLLKHYGWFLGISLVLHALAGPFLAYITMGNRMRIESQVSLSGTPTTLPWDLHLSFYYSSWVPLFFGAILTGLALAVVFGYPLKNKKLANFTHALPVRRGQWLATHLATALIFYGLILAGVSLAYGLVFLQFQGHLPLDSGRFLAQLGMVFAYFALSYALTTLAGVLTGHVLAQVGLSFLFQLGLLILYGAMAIVFFAEWDTYKVGTLSDLAINLSLPARLFQDSIVPAYDGDPISLGATLRYIGELLLATLAAMGLSLIGYRAFPLERVSDTVSQKWVALAVKAYFLFVGSLLMGALIGYSGEASTVRFVIGMVLGAILVHIVAEIALRQSIRGFRQGIVSSLILLLASIGFFASVQQDMWGYDAAIPKSDAREVTLNHNAYYGGYYDPLAGEGITMNDPAFLQNALDMSAFLADNHLQDYRQEAAAAAVGTLPNPEENHSDLSITYGMKGPFKMARTYKIPTSQIAPYLAKFYDNPALWTTAYAKTLSLDYDTLTSLFLTPVILHPDGAYGIHESWSLYFTTPKEQERGTASEAKMQDYAVAADLAPPVPGENLPRLPLEEGQALLEAIQADLQDRTLATLQTPALGTIDLVYDPQDKWYRGDRGENLIFYMGDKRTAALYQKWIDQGLVHGPKDMIADLNITRVYITDSNGIQVYEETTNPQDIYNWILYRTIPSMRTGDVTLTLENDRYAVLTNDTGDWLSEMRPVLKGQGLSKP